MAFRDRPWIMLLLLAMIMMLTVGVYEYSATVLITNMVRSLNMDRTGLGTVVGVNSMCVGLFSPLAGQVVHKWGARRAMIFGISVLLLASVSLATVVASLPALIFVYGVLIGFGVALGTNVPAYTIATYWFNHRVAFAITSIGIATGLGGTIATPLLNDLIATPGGSYKTGWAVAAAGTLVALVLAIFIIRNRPARPELPQSMPGGAPAGPALLQRLRTTSVYKTPIDYQFRDAMRQTSVYWILAALVCAMGANSIVMVHGVSHLLDLGQPSTVAAGFIATTLGFGIVSNTIYALVGDHIEPRFAFGVALLLIGLGLTQLNNPGSGGNLLAVSALLGLGFALPPRCTTTMLINYFGRSAFSRLMGVAMFCMSMGPAVTAVSAGVAFDRFGSYSYVIYFFATACLILACAMPFIRPRGADPLPAYVSG